MTDAAGDPPSRHHGASPATGALVPFTLELSSIRQLLVVDLDDDPLYRTLEPQTIENPDGSTGLVLLAYRHDDRVELYAEPTLEVDASGYDGLGLGLTGIQRTAMEPARFEVTTEGLQVDVAFTAPNGRSVALHLHERLTGARDAFSALAPVGGTFTTPEFFPFIWLPSLSFVPVRGTEAVVRIDGEERTIARLPLPLGGRRCLMARYDPDLMVCQLNANRSTDLARTSSGDITSLALQRGRHTCALRLEPPFPDLQRLPAGRRGEGAVTLQADGVTELRGRYRFRRHDDRAELVIDRIGPWRTRQRRPLLAILFRLPIFRRWPTTYRWHATLELTDPPTVTSRWTRQG